MPRLICKSGGDSEVFFDLRLGVNKLGRLPGNHFQVEHATVSSTHCEITWLDGGIVVRDCNSTNGTFIDDVQISEEWFEIYTPADELHAVSSALVNKGLTVAEAELSEVPKNEIELAPKETVQVMGVIEALEELDDVQQVYSGLSISDEAMAELEAA